MVILSGASTKRLRALLVLSAVAAATVVVVADGPAHAATLATGAVSLEAVNQAGRYVRHIDYLGQLDPVTSSSANQTKLDATFTVVNGLASPTCYSLQTRTGMFLRHRDYRLRVDPNTGDAAFRADATFCAVEGSVSGSVALVSYNYPSRRIRHRDYALWLDAYQDTAAFRADSAFRLVAPWVPKTTKSPVLPGLYADPNIVRFGDTFYIYPTTDGFAGWSGTQFKAYSSTDLVHWTDHGVILDLGPDVSLGGQQRLGADDRREERQVLLVLQRRRVSGDTRTVGVAVADSPDRPVPRRAGQAAGRGRSDPRAR